MVKKKSVSRQVEAFFNVAVIGYFKPHNIGKVNKVRWSKYIGRPILILVCDRSLIVNWIVLQWQTQLNAIH